MMDFPIHIEQSAWICSSHILRDYITKFLNFDIILSLNIVFILANSTDQNEMLHYVVFYRCLLLAKVCSEKQLKDIKILLTIIHLGI